jgi:hypothetical protein
MGHISKYHTNLVIKCSLIFPIYHYTPISNLNCFCWIPYQSRTKNFYIQYQEFMLFLPMVSILNHPFVCILKYLQHLQKICELFHRVFCLLQANNHVFPSMCTFLSDGALFHFQWWCVIVVTTKTFVLCKSLNFVL